MKWWHNSTGSPVFPVEEKKPIRIDVGSGTRLSDGWIGVDPYSDADVTASAWNLPYLSGEVDEIRTSHALEHIELKMIVPTLREFKRVTRIGGTVTICVPNLKWCVLNWLESGCGDGWELQTIFGNQSHPGEFHKTGFTKPLMEKYLAEAGFVSWEFVEITSHGQPTMKFVVTNTSHEGK